MGKITKLLVANRSEIALRVMRSAKEMGISTVAIYSDADELAPHVRYADEAVRIGPPPASESYLNIDKILEISINLNVDAIHPGYGFLSENADFASKVSNAGIIFIGPSPKSIVLMGDKIAAKKAVAKYNIPLVPGIDHAVKDPEEAKKMAADIGYPLLIKASAGGGGKGMRIVNSEAMLAEEMERAVSEAVSAFGNGSVFLEKYIESNKHIEFQILGDKHGNVIHLYERECSIQRRHQKVVEEAPSAILTEALRAEMGQAAINVAKSCDYYGAGTVEFIFDQQGKYFFLEMNTRLQVEHPVTEEITGLDLVKEQIRISEGQALTIKQEDLNIRGHAIEVRVYAEDPTNNFMPAIGKLNKYVRPQGPGIRVDDGFEEGMIIPIYYDPMISKLVVLGESRTEAIDRMTRAISEYEIIGVETTLDFCKFVINHESFKDGTFNTKFVEDHYKPEYLNSANAASEDELKVAAIVASRLHDRQSKNTSAVEAKGRSRWRLRSDG